MKEEEIRKVARAGGDVPFITSPKDATMLFTDGVKGVMVSNQVVKFTLFEHVMDEHGQLFGRHTNTIVTPVDSFLAISDFLATIAAQIRENPMSNPAPTNATAN